MKITSFFAARAAFRSLFFNFLLVAIAALCGTGCRGLPTYASADPNRPNYMKWQGANQVTFVNETAGLVKIYTLAHQEIEEVAPHSTVTISVNMAYYEGWAEHGFLARCYTLDSPPAQVGKEALLRTTVSNADNGYGFQSPRVNVIRIYNHDFQISRW
jgi:hypothetical protein